MNSVDLVEKEISFSGQNNEQEYFAFHRNRYARFASFLEKEFGQRLPSEKLSVLDIGSHYLHSSMVLSHMGFSVDGMDVEEFWNLPFVAKRGEKFGINPILENDLAHLPRFQNISDRYDLIVFTEIFEHITFNPIQLWKTLYQILKPGGMIYISTPNALALGSLVRSFKNLVSLKSIGITVDDIFSKVTYGHHWKEYTPREIKSYFHQLSTDFEVEIHPYHYKNYELKPPFLVFKALSRLGNLTKTFADDLEVVVKLPQKKSWKIKPPTY